MSVGGSGVVLSANFANEVRKERGAKLPGGSRGYDLYKMQEERPELFAKKDEEELLAEQLAAPAGFRLVEEGLFYSKEQQLFWRAPEPGPALLNAPGARPALLDKQGEYFYQTAAMARVPFVFGPKFPLEVSVGAQAVGGPPAPKHVLIPDLHKAATMMKLPLAHLASPAALCAVYGHGSGCAAPDAVAKQVHVRLLQRLAAERAPWEPDELKDALAGTFAAVAEDLRAPVAAAALLQVGNRLILQAGPGSVAIVVRDGDDAAEAQACAAGETRSIEIDAAGPAALVALATMPGECAAAAIAKTVLEAPLKGRPKAASCAVHELFRTLPPGPRAVAVVRIETDGEPAEGERPAKRARVDETRVRCRQILIKHSGSKKPQDLQRKPVKRTLDAAIQLGLQAVRSLGKGEGFMPICRQLSECPSKLRGGEMAGDIGWLDREKGADVVEDANKTGASVAAVVPTAILGPAFSLTVGQLSDLVLSEEGVHILQRTA